MAKKKSDEETSNLDLFDVDPDELDAAIAGLPSDDATITVYRCKPSGVGHPVFCASYPPSEFTLDMVQEVHGGGKYNLVARRGREVVKRMRVEIEGEPKNNAPVSAYLRRVLPDGRHVFMNKREIDEKQQQEAAQQAAQKGSDPLLLILMNEIRSLKDSLQIAKPESSRREFLEELVMYKNLFAPTSNPVADNTKMVTELISKGLEIGADAANGNVNSKGGWQEIIHELLPVAQQAISAAIAKSNMTIAAQTYAPGTPEFQAQQFALRRNGAAEIPLKTPGMSDILPDVNNQPPQATGFKAIAPVLIPYLPVIVSVASRDGNPEAICEVIEANISEEQKPHAIEWLQSPVWFKDLVSVDPRIELQSAWWQELHGYLLGALTGIPGEPTGDPDENVQ